MRKETHIGLVIINEKNRLNGVKYMLSKWERELGEVLTIDGKKWTVGIIGNNKDSVVKELNKIVKIENSITRKENKIANAKYNNEWNTILADGIKKYTV